MTLRMQGLSDGASHRTVGGGGWSLSPQLRCAAMRWLPDGASKNGLKADGCVTDSERRFRALIEASSEVLYRMSPDWGEMLELEGGGFLPNTTGPSRGWLLNYIPAEDRARVTAAIDDAIRTRSVFQLEHRVVWIDGGFGWTVSRAVPVLDDAGEIVEWFGAASDVTARRTAELELRQLNDTLEQRVEERSAALRLYENIVQSDTSPVVAFDTECRLTAFNKAHDDYFQRLYGVQSRLGDVFPQQVGPGEAPLLKDFMTRALGGETFTVCAEFGDPARERVYWEITYTRCAMKQVRSSARSTTRSTSLHSCTRRRR